MLQEFQRFGGRDVVRQFRERRLECFLGVSGGASDQRLDLATRLLVRVNVGQVARQQHEPAAGRLDAFLNALDLVRTQVVYEGDLPREQRGSEILPRDGDNRVRIGRSLNGHRRSEPSKRGAAQGRELVVAASRHRSHRPLVPMRSRIEAYHVGLDRRLVDEEKARWLEMPHLFAEGHAFGGQVVSILLERPQWLFSRDRHAAPRKCAVKCTLVGADSGLLREKCDVLLKHAVVLLLDNRA